MDRENAVDAGTANADELGREFFAAIDARDPRRLRATLANHASFRALPHRELIRPADEIVAYFGTVVISYPTARWEVTDVVSDGELIERGSAIEVMHVDGNRIVVRKRADPPPPPTSRPTDKEPT